jgi:hypothetical protein
LEAGVFRATGPDGTGHGDGLRRKWREQA